MAKRTRVLLLIPHLGGGGAEQVIALLARGLRTAKFDVHLGLVTSSAIPGDLARFAAVHSIAANRVRYASVPLIRLVRKVRPDVVLSGMSHLNFLVILLRPFFPRSTRVIVRQNATVSSDLSGDRRGRRTRMLYRLLYSRADRVICQSQAMADDLVDASGVAAASIAVLPNPLDFEHIRAMRDGASLWCGAGPHLLAVGRLAPEKGFDLLLESLAAVRMEFPNADLVVAGEGSERIALEELVRRLRLDSAVRFVGHVDDPCSFFPGATLFVLSSRREGMPNALLEAAVGGLPLVAMPASGGVVDLLADCAGAWVASSVSAAALTEAMAKALRELVAGERFERDCLQNYMEAIANYEELLSATAALKR